MPRKTGLITPKWKLVWTKSVVDAARAGNFEPLIDYLKWPWSLSQDMRDVVIQILQGKLKRAKNAPSQDVAETRLLMAYEVAELRRSGTLTEPAVAAVCQRYGMSARSVYAAMRAYQGVDIEAGVYEAIVLDKVIMDKSAVYDAIIADKPYCK
jgi:hypothetical protein